MKLHLPKTLRKSLLHCVATAAVAAVSYGSAAYGYMVDVPYGGNCWAGAHEFIFYIGKDLTINNDNSNQILTYYSGGNNDYGYCRYVLNQDADGVITLSLIRTGADGAKDDGYTFVFNTGYTTLSKGEIYSVTHDGKGNNWDGPGTGTGASATLYNSAGEAVGTLTNKNCNMNGNTAGVMNETFNQTYAPVFHWNGSAGNATLDYTSKNWQLRDSTASTALFKGADIEFGEHNNDTAEELTIAESLYVNTVTVKGDYKITGAATSNIDATTFAINNGGLTLASAVNATQLQLGADGASSLTISAGGSLSISGTNNNHSNAASILLGRTHDSELVVDGGVLNASGAVVRMSWGGQGTLKVLNGTANVKGLNFWGSGSYNDLSGIFQLGSDAGDGTARINIGSEGIVEASYKNTTDAMSVTLSNGVIGATANWSTGYNTGFTPVKFVLTGTRTGTVFDTTDANDKTTARHITLNNELAGSGNLVVDGKGSLTLNKASSYTGSTTVNQDATLKLNSGGTYTLSNTVTGTGTLQVESGTTLKNNGQSISARLVLNGGDAVISGSQALQDNGGTYTLSNTVTGTGTLQVESGTTLKNNGQSISARLVLNGGDAVMSGSQALKGNITIKDGSTLSFSEETLDHTKAVTWRVETGGTIDYGTTRQAFGRGSVLELAGGRVIGTGNSHQGVALGAVDFTSGSKAHAIADTTVEANVRLRSTIEFEVDDEKTLILTGVVKDDRFVTDGGERTGALNKTGTGTLKLSNANDYSKGTTISAGILETANAAALGTGKVTVNGGILKLAEALSVSAMDYVSGSIQADNDLTVTGTLKVAGTGNMAVTGNGKVQAQTLQLESGASFTAGGQVSMNNLTMNAGSAITADSAVALNGTLTLHSGITLAGTVLDTLAGLQAPVVLFTGVDSLVLGGQPYTVGSETLNTGSNVKLSDYFRNDSEIDFDKYYLAFNASTGELTAGLIIPEPTTATLSLLALAGLCARRRRK